SGEVGVAEISARVGPAIKDKAPPLGLELRPRLKGVKAARLSRSKGGEPFALELTLEAAARPTVAALRERFGAYEEAPARLEQPRSVLFNPPPAARWKVVVIAELESRGGTVQDSDKVVS